jgi:diguanylate cyclase (GGDEF)-like protein/PAS domain S-box-containing protein
MASRKTYIRGGSDVGTLLECISEHVHQGLTIVDRELSLRFVNRRAQELLDLAPEFFKDGVTLEDIFRHNAERGEYGPGDPDQQVGERIELATRFEFHDFTRTRPDGTAIRIQGTPLKQGGFVTTYTNVTDQTDREAAFERSMRDSSRKNALLDSYRRALDAHALVSVSDRSGYITDVNDRLCQLSGYSRDELIGQTHRFVHARGKASDYFRTVWRNLMSGEPWSGDVENRNKDGESYWVHETITPIIDEHGQIESFFTVGTDITILKCHEEELEATRVKLTHTAGHDPLTELPNRRTLDEKLSTFLEQHQAQDPTSLFVFHLDLDGFKAVNDTLGHAAGDELLCQVADLLNRHAGAAHTIARVGGDEFVILLEARSRDTASALATSIIQESTTPFRLSDGPRVDVGISIGISAYPDDGQTAEDLLIAADLALYLAKNNGKGRHTWFQPHMREEFQHKVELANKLQIAIKEDQFQLLYQPQFHMETSKIVGIEALVRWNHPDEGMVSPEWFLDIAKSSGLMVQIGEFVLNEAVRTAAEWHNRGYEFGRIAVNLSAAELANTEMIDLIVTSICEHQLPTELLSIEILEDAIVHHQSSRLCAFIDELIDIGVDVVFDDFGTGYASLVHLQKFPVSKIKIDPEFIRDICDSARDQNIIRGMLQIAEELGLKVIVEGIETSQQAEVLYDMGCRMAQGYLYSRPLERAKMEAMLARRAAARTEAAVPHEKQRSA